MNTKTNFTIEGFFFDTKVDVFFDVDEYNEKYSQCITLTDADASFTTRLTHSETEEVRYVTIINIPLKRTVVGAVSHLVSRILEDREMESSIDLRAELEVYLYQYIANMMEDYHPKIERLKVGDSK